MSEMTPIPLDAGHEEIAQRMLAAKTAFRALMSQVEALERLEPDDDEEEAARDAKIEAIWDVLKDHRMLFWSLSEWFWNVGHPSLGSPLVATDWEGFARRRGVRRA